jgi:8-oxo-dGTP pyrophosphatase MutT (NUDIX family)
VFSNGSQILVGEARDVVKNQTFHRPIGGEIHFGETSERAMRREIDEELGLEVSDLRLLGVTENVFTFEGEQGHEIVFVFDARFSDAAVYSMPSLQGVESTQEAFRAVWRDPHAAEGGAVPLYPDGLRELLAQAGV